MPVTVVMSTMPMPHGTGSAGQMRSQYSSAKQIEMTWNGIVSRDGHKPIAATFSTTRSTQATSSLPRPSRSRGGPRGGRGRGRPGLSDSELIALTFHRGDELVAEFRPQPPDADSDDV